MARCSATEESIDDAMRLQMGFAALKSRNSAAAISAITGDVENAGLISVALGWMAIWPSWLESAQGWRRFG